MAKNNLFLNLTSVFIIQHEHFSIVKPSSFCFYFVFYFCFFARVYLLLRRKSISLNWTRFVYQNRNDEIQFFSLEISKRNAQLRYKKRTILFYCVKPYYGCWWWHFQRMYGNRVCQVGKKFCASKMLQMAKIELIFS